MRYRTGSRKHPEVQDAIDRAREEQESGIRKHSLKRKASARTDAAKMTRQHFNWDGSEKIKFGTESNALRKAMKLMDSPRFRGGLVNAYQCGECKQWHIGRIF